MYGHVRAAYRSRCDGMLGSNDATNPGMIADGFRARMVIERATRRGSALQSGARGCTLASARLHSIHESQNPTRLSINM